MAILSLPRPKWSRTFIEEPEEHRVASAKSQKSPPFRAVVLGVLALAGFVLQLWLLDGNLKKWWSIGPAIIWGLLFSYLVLLRPRRFSLIVLTFNVVLVVANGILVLKTWQSNFRLIQRLAIGTLALAVTGTVLTLNMSMREPGWSKFGISKPFSEPSDKFRSPEDDLTFFQWMTVSWVSPLLRRGKQRQLNEDDIWQLPYEFQHTRLHEAFRKLKGTVLRRLLSANWIDLVILTLLELLEIVTKYVEPLLLQQLLRSMQDSEAKRRSALTYALLILLARVINAQSEVFSLWYGRRCYERSRGEMITMLYEKTLNRKVVAQPKTGEEEEEGDGAGLDRVPTSLSTDETTPLLKQSTDKESSALQKMWTNMKSVLRNFRIGVKGAATTKQRSAGLGKIMNLMRYDAYEVAQRFWDFQDLVEKPLGLVLSIALACRLLGWPALVGVGVIILGQVLNYLLTLVNVRLEKARRVTTDKRLQQTSQYIESIRHLRWYGWQNYWLENVFKARQKELNMRVVAFVWSQLVTLNTVISIGSTIVAAFWAYTALAHRSLSVDIIFPAIQIFYLIEDSLSDIPDLIQSLLNAYVALQRIQIFMDEPEKHDPADESTSDVQVILERASFAWPGLSQNVLHEIELSFDVGINVVVGEVASGKTALLQAILGEIDRTTGEIHKPLKPIAYCSQTPWLQSMTIRENILFNSPYESERYKKVLQVCALIHDLATFEKGDLSPIGENGIGLSGGQKMRVALARAIYSDASILLLDDPLSALDQQTSEYIVRECFQGDLMKGRTVVLVTHRTDLCEPIADQIVMMQHGRSATRSSTVFGAQDVHSYSSKVNGQALLSEPKQEVLDSAIPDKFEDVEVRAHGDIKARVYWEYLKAGSFSAWIVIALSISVVRLVAVGMNWYLKEFGEGYRKTEGLQQSPFFLFASAYESYADRPSILRRLFDHFPDPRTNTSPWLLGLLFLVVVQALAVIFSHISILTARYLSGKNLFRAVLLKVTNTTFRYYDITPVGRLMNRLTSDMGQVDSGIGSELYRFLYSSIAWVVNVVVIGSVTPLFLASTIALTISFVMVFFHFLPTSQALRRLETVSLSPLMSNFGALLAGLTTVRAFRAEPRFQANLIKVVDNFQGMDHFYWSAQGWLSYRLDIMSAVGTFALTVIAIYTDLTAGLTAFVLVSAQKLVQTTHSVCRVYGQLQVNFVSVERVVELLDLEQEPTNEVPPPAWWPSFGGSVVFENVTIRYAPEFDPALTDISFEIKGGTNTAIVGRTGSGKSTLAAALLATVPVEKGRIIVDGVDLATVDRQALRSRITFLAQEPVLFDGTLRHNLDPTKEHSDQDCENVIHRVAGRFGWTLSMNIETGGKNLSQGQRQLIGLIRAILRRSSIIIMDEATASIDVDTAWEIQRVLREELKRSTVITIAHRTAAVRDADNTIELSNGRLVSFGPASESSTTSTAQNGGT